MFNRQKRQQRLLETINMIKPTSKAALKQQCLFMANLDVDKAERMYDFLTKGMDNIPDVEPASRPFLQNFGEQASGIIGWFRENKDVIGEAVDFIKGIVASRRGGVPSSAPLPPING